MKKLFCDRCGRETDEIDLHEIKVCRFVSRAPSIKNKEICAFCKEKLNSWLATEVSA